MLSVPDRFESRSCLEDYQTDVSKNSICGWLNFQTYTFRTPTSCTCILLNELVPGRFMWNVPLTQAESVPSMKIHASSSLETADQYESNVEEMVIAYFRSYVSLFCVNILECA